MLNDCKMHFLNMYLSRKEIRHFVEHPVKNQPLLNYFWDISRNWERLKGTNLLLFFVFFFFLFAYTTSPAAVMKLVVSFRSSKPPYTFWWSGIADSHCAIRSGWCLLHLWRTCSVVWTSSSQGHVGEGTIFRFLCMCALNLLLPERSRAKTTWPGLSRRWYASFSCLGFSDVLMMVVFSW